MTTPPFSSIHPIATDTYRINTGLPDAMPGGFSFNQYLVVDERPLLFHTGPRKLFPLIREQMAAALHLILQLQRFADGTRRIVKVTEVTGQEGPTVTLQDIFVFETTGVTAEGKTIGRYRPTGLRPTHQPPHRACSSATASGLTSDDKSPGLSPR